MASPKRKPIRVVNRAVHDLCPSTKIGNVVT
jgi:hypothetical protein